MTRWKQGQDIYDQLIANLAEYTCEHNSSVISESSVTAYAKACVPDFINALKVNEVVLIHEFLMHKTAVRKDIRTPVYEYSGGDRIMSITGYMQRNMHLELSKLYA